MLGECRGKSRMQLSPLARQRSPYSASWVSACRKAYVSVSGSERAPGGRPRCAAQQATRAREGR